MEKIEWGPNWEEILGTEFAKRSKDVNFEGIQKDIYGQFENTFMMYLPRLGEHCLNPACVAACPSGAIYKREEDGIVLIDQDKCRGWRMFYFGDYAFDVRPIAAQHLLMQQISFHKWQIAICSHSFGVSEDGLLWSPKVGVDAASKAPSLSEIGLVSDCSIGS